MDIFAQAYEQGPKVFIPVLLLNLALTLIIYSAFPLIFAKVRKSPITKKKYYWICFAVNIGINVNLNVISGSMSGASVWTWLFAAIGWESLNYKKKKVIKRKYEPYKSRFTECPKCGYIAVFEKVCPKCEFVLPVEAQSDASSQILKVLYCRKCGTKLLEGEKVCRECRTKIGTKVKENTDVL